MYICTYVQPALCFLWAGIALSLDLEGRASVVLFSFLLIPSSVSSVQLLGPNCKLLILIIVFYKFHISS